MTFVRKPRMAKLTQQSLPQPFLGRKVKPVTLNPEQVKRQQLRRQLRSFTQQFTTAQNQAVNPVFQAVKLEQADRQHLSAERANLVQTLPATAASIADLQAARERQQKRQQPETAPLKPVSPDDWVTVMKAQARQAEGRSMSTRELQQFTALQHQVVRTLVQAYRQDRQPATARTAQFAARLAALHDHPISGQVAKVVLNQIPQGERPTLQRAVDDTVQREAELRAHDAAILQSADAFERLASLEAESRKPLSERIQARRGAGNPLPEAVRRHLEQGLNHDLSRVRIHDDDEADKMAKGVNAIAFTTGTDIFFQKGKFNPNTQTGLELLAHEVTHTVQQSRGKVSGGIDANPGLEQEAQTQGRKLAQEYAKNPAQPTRKTKSSRPRQSVKAAAKPARQAASQQNAAVQRSVWGADWWRQFVNKGAEQALELAAKVPNGAAIVAAFKSNKAVFKKVIANPRPFFTNLIGSVKNGFLQFKNQIGKHLQGALVDWLAGTSIAGTGRVIAFPKSLSGRELLGFGMDVLGLNYAGLLTRLGKKYGAEKVRKAEGQLALLQQATLGLHKLNDFRHMDNQARDGVITAARNYALQSVAQQAVVWASSFAASGGLIPLAKTAFNLISTILQNASTFQSLGQTVLSSVADIANGRTAAAANKVEQNLVRVMGLVMKFLSKMLGLDKISGAIRKGLAALQKPINTVIDRIVASKPVAAFFAKFSGKAGHQALSPSTEKQKDHDERVRKGLADIPRIEKSFAKNGKLENREAANKVARAVKARHNIFKSVKPRFENTKVVYDWVASSGSQPGATGLTVLKLDLSKIRKEFWPDKVSITGKKTQGGRPNWSAPTKRELHQQYPHLHQTPAASRLPLVGKYAAPGLLNGQDRRHIYAFDQMVTNRVSALNGQPFDPAAQMLKGWGASAVKPTFTSIWQGLKGLLTTDFNRVDNLFVGDEAVNQKLGREMEQGEQQRDKAKQVASTTTDPTRKAQAEQEAKNQLGVIAEKATDVPDGKVNGKPLTARELSFISIISGSSIRRFAPLQGQAASIKELRGARVTHPLTGLLDDALIEMDELRRNIDFLTAFAKLGDVQANKAVRVAVIEGTKKLRLLSDYVR